jgi:hypothetical protein
MKVKRYPGKVQAIGSLVEHFALSRTIVGARINNADAQKTVLTDRSVAIKTEISDLTRCGY